MPKRPTHCQRKHPLTKANARIQDNAYTSVDGSRRVYRTVVCRACARLRTQRKAAGKPVKDLRVGRR